MATAQASGGSNPAPGAPAVNTLPPPENASDWANAILLGLGINPEANNGASLNALIAQMHVEDPSLSYLSSPTVNNPLAVTNSGGTPIPGNSAGVQSYSNWLTGLAATIADIKANPAMLAALQNGSSCQQYGGAVAKSNWEGKGGTNASYGAGVASACNLPAVKNATSNSAFGQALANSNLAPNILSELGNPALGAAGVAASAVSDTASIATVLGDLTDPTKLRRVGVFALGAVIFLIGMAGFISTTKEGQKVISQGESAASVAALA